jgi:Divergent InlB B-repeat domain
VYAFEGTVTAPVGPQLTIDTSTGTGTGTVNCEVNGTSTDEPCASVYPDGTELKLIPVAGPHSEFAQFENATGSAETVCEATAICEFTIEEDTTLDAPSDLITHTLTVEPTGEGEVNAEAAPTPLSGAISGCEEGGGGCAAEYNAGETVTLVATPETGWEVRVGGWTGCDAEPSANECEVEIPDGSAPTVEVRFQEEGTSTLTINKTGSGASTVQCEDNSGGLGACAASYPNGHSIKVVARRRRLPARHDRRHRLGQRLHGLALHLHDRSQQLGERGIEPDPPHAQRRSLRRRRSQRQRAAGAGLR